MTHYGIAWLIYSTLFFAPSFQGQVNGVLPDQVVEKKDIPYFTGEGRDPKKHRLDLFIPPGGKKAKVLVFVHGGAWVQGDKSFMGIYSSLGRYFAKNGILTVVISYRLVPAVKNPEQAGDVAKAIAWTVKNIGNEGGDPEQIYLCGHSAGGHLVSLIGCDSSFLRSEGIDPKVVRGVVSLSGVFDVSRVGFGKVFGWVYEGKKNASPVKQVKEGLPPFLLICADKDLGACSPAECQKFKKELEAKGNRVELEIISGSNHIKILFDAMKTEKKVSQQLIQFVKTGLPEKRP